MPRPPLPPGPFLIAGLARAGTAAAGALRERGVILGWDARDAPAQRAAAARLRRCGASVRLGADAPDLLASVGRGGTLVKSPGLGFDHPLLMRAQALDVQIMDELELGWRLTRRPIVGVTGTNGKSTTCALVCELLRRSGHEVVLAGNTEFGSPLSAASAVETTDWIVCEVSSFQLEGAQSFLPEVAVFTNLTTEHLDRHGTLPAYGALKRTMFVRGDRTAGISVINCDDPFGLQLAEAVRQQGGRVLTYGFGAEADIRILDASWDMRTTSLRLSVLGRELELTTLLPGAHNASNVAAAVGVALALELPQASVAQGLAQARAPGGRWELLEEGQQFDVVVDYAHTPDGIRRVLETLRATVDPGSGSVLTVFGPVGLAEPIKAAQSGYWARMLSDHLILTTGSAPDSGRVARIAELRRAAGRGGTVEVVLERRAAIARALSVARPGDVVAILGLGQLSQLALDATGALEDHSDLAVARELLRQRG